MAEAKLHHTAPKTRCGIVMFGLWMFVFVMVMSFETEGWARPLGLLQQQQETQGAVEPFVIPALVVGVLNLALVGCNFAAMYKGEYQIDWGTGGLLVAAPAIVVSFFFLPHIALFVLSLVPPLCLLGVSIANLLLGLRARPTYKRALPSPASYTPHEAPIHTSWPGLQTLLRFP